MAKSIFGLYWRALLFILFISFILSPIWYFFHSDNLIFIKKSSTYIVCGIFLLLPLARGYGILYLLKGKKLSLKRNGWVIHRKIIGLLYVIFSIMTYIVHLYLPFYIWVYLIVYGNIFMLWFLPLIVAILISFYDAKIDKKIEESQLIKNMN
ncbi:hypothetical protein DMZ75_24255 [Salmonella enterica subsp. diarizonae]|nr:hypothetical protein [Salmonella enterica subsp. diarizonae]